MLRVLDSFKYLIYLNIFTCLKQEEGDKPKMGYLIILGLIALFLGIVIFSQRRSQKTSDSVNIVINREQQEIKGYGEQTWWHPGRMGEIEAGAKPNSGPPDQV